jgi:hypothetical protein
MRYHTIELAYQAILLSQFQRRLYSYSSFGFIPYGMQDESLYTAESPDINALFR